MRPTWSGSQSKLRSATWWRALAAALLLCLAPNRAIALSAGRAWTAQARLDAPGFSYLAAPRLERDSSGVPLLIASAIFGPDGRDDAFGFRWADSSWVSRWRVGQLTFMLWPIQSPTGTVYLAWCGGPTNVYNLMMWTQVVGDSVLPVDTVTTVMTSRSEYSGAVSAKRRWLVVSDDQGHRELRVLHGDLGGPWRQAPVVGLGEFGVAAATLDDTTALVAWAGRYEGVEWGELRGDTWAQVGQLLPPYQYLANAPRLRRRLSGGQWLAWGTWDPHIILTSYRDGVWAPQESLRCAYLDGTEMHLSDSPDLSRDDDRYEYPVAVWGSQDLRGHFNICACIPTDSGYGVGEELPQALDGGLPTVVRDRNDDVWVAWWMTNYVGGVHWSHTYTTAVADTPRVVGAGRLRAVRWRLSEPASRTWWAVERARGDDAFEKVARVRAAPGLEQAWTDASPPAGLVRYRIRRESVDKRYEWLSAEARWPAKAMGPRILRLSANPVAERLQFEITDAVAGPLEAKLYDLQGRVVWRTVATSAGTGRDAFKVDLPGVGARLRPGVYFLRARDASGRESTTAKIAIVQ